MKGIYYLKTVKRTYIASFMGNKLYSRNIENILDSDHFTTILHSILLSNKLQKRMLQIFCFNILRLKLMVLREYFVDILLTLLWTGGGTLCPP